MESGVSIFYVFCGFLLENFKIFKRNFEQFISISKCARCPQNTTHMLRRSVSATSHVALRHCMPDCPPPRRAAAVRVSAMDSYFPSLQADKTEEHAFDATGASVVHAPCPQALASSRSGLSVVESMPSALSMPSPQARKATHFYLVGKDRESPRVCDIGVLAPLSSLSTCLAQTSAGVRDL